MKTARVLTLILASPLFFVVSCSGSTWIIGDALSRWQAMKNPTRHVRAIVATAEGDLKYAESKSEVERMERELAEYKTIYDEFNVGIDDAKYPYSFLLPVSAGRIDISPLRHIRFDVKSIGDGQQEIALSDIDDDYQIRIIYRAKQTQITPVYSRILGVGHFMRAGFYALVLSLKKRQNRSTESV